MRPGNKTVRKGGEGDQTLKKESTSKHLGIFQIGKKAPCVHPGVELNCGGRG